MRSFPERESWEKHFAAQQPRLVTRAAVAALIGVVGFAITTFFARMTGFYFPSLTVVSAILAGLYGGLYIGLTLAIALGLAADFFFIPPVGSVLSSREDVEHLLIAVVLAAFAAFMGSSLRQAFQRVISAKQEAERSKQEAERARQEAERASILMEKTLALVSHDIRNPLSAIKMGAQLIHMTPGQTDKHQPILVRMMSSLERADAMIQSLLDVARLRAGKTLPLEFRECDLSAQLGQMIEEMSLLGFERVRFTPGEPLWGAWALGGLRRILDNLVSNAVKYGDPHAPIVVSLERRQNLAVLTVQNQGPEIPPEVQDKLFDAFQRAENAERRGVRGWGLGLAVVKGIAESHGGTVRIESGKTTGTKMILELPIRRLEQIRAS